VLAGHHQHVAIGDRKGVRECDGVLVLNPDAVSANGAEGTGGIQTGRIAPCIGTLTNIRGTTLRREYGAGSGQNPIPHTVPGSFRDKVNVGVVL
jgi:hypothetical protein